jgi:tetratricopeptide (TPR) repeat protein
MSDISNHQYIERARLLLYQKRYKDAEAQAGIALQDNPNNVHALQIIGHCRLDTKQYDEALRIFKVCLGIEPEEDYLHYLTAFCYYRKHELETSLLYLEKAIALFPYNAGYFSLLSNIYVSQRKWADALYAANKGLHINAEDIACLNGRSAALFRLNKKDEAYETINEALQVDPEDDFTHTNYGWHYLEKGKHEQATEHFKESLRINPNSNSAKEGYKAALKSKLPFYRWILQYSLWMNHQSRGVRIAMVFGLWILIRAIAEFTDSTNIWLRYAAGSIVFLYLLFVVLSWLGSSLANLFLSITRYGKLALTNTEKNSAKAVGLSLLIGITLLIYGAFVNRILLYAGLIVCSFAIPLNFIQFPLKLFRGTAREITAHLIILLGILTTTMLFFSEQSALFFGILYFVFVAGFMWGGSIKNI